MSQIQVYERITRQVLDALEDADANGWSAPWAQLGMGYHQNAVSRRAYSGINQIVCIVQAARHGYKDPRWLTYNQAKKLGGFVRLGEKKRSATILFFKPWETTDRKTGEKITIPVARAYTVYNVEQCDGIPRIEDGHTHEPTDILEFARSIVPAVNLGGDKAFHHPATRTITMPHLSQFTSQAAFDATLLHELIHWTAPDVERRKDSYAFEELVAELGAVFLCGAFEIPYQLEHHASYLKSWLQALRDDPAYIVQAARQAQKAADYLLEKANPAEVAA